MKFLLDANIPYSAKESFPKQHEIFHLRDLHLQHSSDEEIIVWAQKHKSALITRDFDFANILNFPPAKHSGIIVLKIPISSVHVKVQHVTISYKMKLNCRRNGTNSRHYSPVGKMRLYLLISLDSRLCGNVTEISRSGTSQNTE